MGSLSSKAGKCKMWSPWCMVMYHAVHMPCFPVELCTINTNYETRSPLKQPHAGVKFYVDCGVWYEVQLTTACLWLAWL